MSLPYPTTCPCCGGALTPVVSTPDNAPWVCQPCFIGWWTSELSPDARNAWVPEYRQMHRQSGVKQLVADEAALACQRGCSLREEMVPLIATATLNTIASRFRISDELAAAIAAQVQEQQ